MNGTNEILPGLVDFRLLAPEQLERLKRQGMLSARRERVETLRALSDWLGTALRRGLVETSHRARQWAVRLTDRTAGRICAFQTWRAHRAAIAALRERSDHDLADIGLRRSEIVSAVRGLEREPTRRRHGGRLQPVNQETGVDRAA